MTWSARWAWIRLRGIFVIFGEVWGLGWLRINQPRACALLCLTNGVDSQGRIWCCHLVLRDKTPHRYSPKQIHPFLSRQVITSQNSSVFPGYSVRHKLFCLQVDIGHFNIIYFLIYKGMVSLWNLFAFWYMNGHVSWSGLLAVQMNTKGKRSGSILTTFISGPSIRANKGILFPAAISIFSFFCRHTLQLQAMCDDNALFSDATSVSLTLYKVSCALRDHSGYRSAWILFSVQVDNWSIGCW